MLPAIDTLTTGSPIGGTYNGPGVNNGKFNPSSLSTGNYSVNYAYTNANGCTDSAKSTITVVDITAAPGIISGPVVAVCTNSSKSYSIAPLTGATSYTWTPPANASIASGQGSASVTVNFNGSFTSGSLSVTANDACGSSSASQVAISSVPSTPARIFGNPLPCKRELNLYWVTPVPGATAYTWNDPPGSHSRTGPGTDTIGVRTANKSGSITVYASNACGTNGNLASLSVNTNCRTSDPSADAEAETQDIVMNVYPNPAHDVLNVHFESTTENNYLFRIYDMTGRLVHNEVKKAEIGDNLIELNLNNAAGMYIISLSSGDLNKQTKILIE